MTSWGFVVVNGIDITLLLTTGYKETIEQLNEQYEKRY